MLDKVEFIANYPPTSLKRHRHTKFGSHTYDPSSNDKKEFISRILQFIPNKPIEGPIKVELKFYEKRPKSHYRSGKFSNLLKKNAPKYNVSKKDIDNFVKFVFDSLNKKMYNDDSQIFELICGKYYSESNGYIYCKFEEILEESTLESNESNQSNISNVSNVSNESNIGSNVLNESIESNVSNTNNELNES